LACSCLALQFDQKGRIEHDRSSHDFFCASPKPLPAAASTHSMRSSPVSIGPARSINARITSDFGIFLRLAQRARRSARFLSSFTVIVGMVIPQYYHVLAGHHERATHRPDVGAISEQQRPNTTENRAPSRTRRRSQALPKATQYGLQNLHPRFKSGRRTRRRVPQPHARGYAQHPWMQRVRCFR
jgi:hypothetical protein